MTSWEYFKYIYIYVFLSTFYSFLITLKIQMKTIQNCYLNNGIYCFLENLFNSL